MIKNRISTLSIALSMIMQVPAGAVALVPVDPQDKKKQDQGGIKLYSPFRSARAILRSRRRHPLRWRSSIPKSPRRSKPSRRP